MSNFQQKYHHVYVILNNKSVDSQKLRGQKQQDDIFRSRVPKEKNLSTKSSIPSKTVFFKDDFENKTLKIRHP